MKLLRSIFVLAFVWLSALVAQGATLLTQQQALELAFPKGAAVERQPLFLSEDQIRVVSRMSGAEHRNGLVVRYVGRVGGRIVGYAYFDTHRVRTLPETLMVVVTPDGRVSRIEILSFDEPHDYLPRRAWLDQVHGQRLDRDLSLRGKVRPITGASLSGRAIVNATRRILAVHQVAQGGAVQGEARTR